MYDHNMTAKIAFADATSLGAAISALEPMISYFDWPRDKIKDNQPFCGGDFVTIETSADNIVSMEIYTAGEVGIQYREVLTEFAANLSSIAMPGFLKLRNNDNDCDSKIWYGEPDSISAAKLSIAWKEASSAMLDGRVPENTVDFIGKIVNSRIDVTQAEHIEKVLRADEAQRFFLELENDVGALVEIGKKYGDDTIRDLFYLHSAILSGSYVEHFRNDSLLLEVVDQLTSADKWKKSIQ